MSYPMTFDAAVFEGGGYTSRDGMWPGYVNRDVLAIFEGAERLGRADIVDRPRSGHVVLRSDRAPAPRDRFKLRDGTEVVCTAVGRPYRVDESLDEDYTSFYSSELWEQDVVRVDFEYPDAPAAAEPAMAPQVAQQQQACAGPTASPRLSRDELLSRIRAHDRERDEAVAEIERRAVHGKSSKLDDWLLDGIRASGAILREELAEHDREAMKSPPAAGYRVVKAWVDDADIFQTLTFPMIFERAQDATAEIVSLLGGRDSAKFSAAERERGAVLTMEEVGPAPGPAPVPLQVKQQACATRTPAPKPVRIGGGTIVPLAVVPTHAMADFQVAELVRAALDASTPPADTAQAWRTSVSAVAHAALDAYGAALIWRGMYEEGRHATCDRAYGALFDARVRLQDAARQHADLVAIEAIGPLGGGWELRPCMKPAYFSLTHETAGATPALQVPQGLSNAAYRALVRAYRKGVEVGRRRVKAAVRRSLIGPTLNLEGL